MQERLIIKNFGPIKSVDLNLGKITILIGEQASGKSTVAKLLALCRYFSFIVSEQSYTRENLMNEWGLSEFMQEDTYWYYENEDYSFELIKNELASNLVNESVYETVLKEKSERFKTLIKEYSFIKGEENIFSDPIPSSFLINYVKKIMDNPFYIPTERGLQSIFSLGKSSIQNLSDALFNQFASFDNIYRKFNKETEIEPLDIYYVNQNGKSLIRKKNHDKYFSLSSGASGYQSTIPIVLAIKYYSTKEVRKRTFIIEEPEQNLFPTAQKELVEFLVESVNNFGHKLLITTHSPYIISSFNNLLISFNKSKVNASEVKKLINEKKWFDYNNISAYSLLKDEKSQQFLSENIILNDIKEISIDYLDSINFEINKIWDSLNEIE